MGPLPPAGPGVAPTAPQLLPSTRYPDPKLMVQTSTFFKKKIILYCYLLFLALGQALQFLLLTPNMGFQVEKDCPALVPERCGPFTEDITSGHFLFGTDRPIKP